MRKIGLFCVIVLAILGLCIGSSVTGEEPGDKLLEVFKKDIEPEESLVPAGVVIEEAFEPGKGAAIGTIENIKGRVLAIHQGEKTAYVLKKKYELFTYDTLITAEKSNAQIKFNDGSFITLGTYTKLVLDKSIYDPSKTTRDSFVRLLFGKARFIVTKLVNFRSSKYKVKTPTAVVGVRGSDFAVSVSYGSPLVTTLMTGKDTTVIFAGDIGPPQVAGPGTVSRCYAGQAATRAIPYSGSYTPPQVSGFTTLHYVAGGLAAGLGGVALYNALDDDGSGGALQVESISPSEGTVISGATLFTITFNKAINPVSPIDFNLIQSSADWTISTVNNINSTTVTILVSETTAPTTGFTIELLSTITAADGSGAITGTTQYSYPSG